MNAGIKTEHIKKFTCIYCKKELPISEFTEEHIIPESLGSPLKISSICKRCNSFIGSELESELFYFPPIAGKLSELGLKSKSGRITPFVETGKRAKAKIKEPITGEQIKTRIHLGHKEEFHKIIPTKTKSGRFVVDKSDFEKKKKELEKKGFIVISKAEFEQRKSEFKKSMKLAIYEAQAIPHPFIEIEMWFNVEKVCRSIAKIGLAYMCYKYGPEKALLQNFDDIRSYILTGKPEPRGSLNYDFPCWPSIENYHALSLCTPDKENIIFIMDFFGKWKSWLLLGTYFEGIPSLDKSEITYIDSIKKKVLIVSLGRAIGYKQGQWNLVD